MNWIIFISVIGVLYIENVDGHAALIEPPARNVMWRLGYSDLPEHPEDDYLICVEAGPPGCPPCGDDMAAPSPRPHEAGGAYATGIITRTYSPGQTIDIYVNVTRSHGGYVEFKLCPNNDVKIPVEQNCLDQYPLQIVGKRTSKVKLTAPYDGTEEIKVKAKLPPGLTCSQCVLQMTKLADQFKPTDIMFRNCADIAIESSAKVGATNRFVIKPKAPLEPIGFQRSHVEHSLKGEEEKPATPRRY